MVPQIPSTISPSQTNDLTQWPTSQAWCFSSTGSPQGSFGVLQVVGVEPVLVFSVGAVAGDHLGSAEQGGDLVVAGAFRGPERGDGGGDVVAELVVLVDLVLVVLPVVIVLVRVDERRRIRLQLLELRGQRADFGGVVGQGGGDFFQVVGEGVGPVLDRFRRREQLLRLGCLVVGGQTLELGVDIGPGAADVPGVGFEAAVVLLQLAEVAGELRYRFGLDHLVCTPGFVRSRSGIPKALRCDSAAISRSPFR